MGTTYKRSFRNYLIYKDLQLHLLAQSFIYVSLMVMASIGIILYPLIHDMIILDDLERQYEAAQTFLSMVKWLVPAILTLLVLFMWHLIIITHRICGPLVNFTHIFNRLAEGDLTHKVHLRRGDYLMSEGERINHMIDGISGLINRLRTDHGKLMITLQGMKERAKDIDTKEKLEVALEMIMQEAKYLSDTLSHFKVEEDSTDSGDLTSSR
jgi:methyl-accepting chemotaxis protein